MMEAFFNPAEAKITEFYGKVTGGIPGVRATSTEINGN